MAVIGIVGSAQAVTVNDLMKWGGYCIENTKSDRRFADDGIVRWLSSSVETKFEKVSDTQIRLTGMFDDNYSFTFTLANGYDPKNAGQASTDGTQLVLAGNDLYSYNKNGYYFLSYLLWGGGSDPNKYGMGTGWNIVGEITETEDGYKIVFPSIALRNKSGYGMEQYDAYELEIFEPNAWVTDDCNDYEYHENTEYGRHYPARVDFADDGTFTMKGLAQIGYAMTEDNRLVPFTGQYDPEAKQSKIDRQHVLFAEDTYSDSYGTYHMGWCDYYIYMVDANDELYYGVDGDFNANDYTHKGTNRWVTNDGDCTTEYGIVMNLEEYTFGCTNSSVISGLLTTPIFENTRIETTDECTHSAALTINSFELSEDGQNVNIDATVTPLDNTSHVGSYDLFIVEGNHSSVNDDFFAGSLDEEKGHKDAVHLTSGDYNVAAPDTRVAVGEGHNFLLSVPVDALPGDINSGEGYTMYLRSNYIPTLPGTFHDMQTLEAINTGISAVDADRFISVTAIPGAIRIAGAAKAAIYTLDGKAIYNGADGEIPVAPGIYIVRAGNKAVKTIVK